MDTQIRKSFVHLFIIFIFLNTLGFPGSYSLVFGHTIQMIIEYAAFLMEIILMVAFSADHFMELKLFEVKGKYGPIYLFLIAMFFMSMIGTSDIKEQLITCIRVCVTAFFGIWLCEHLTLEELLTDLYHAQILYVLVSVAFPVLFKSYDVRSASYASDFVGIGGVKNVVASELAFGIISCVMLWKIRKQHKTAHMRLLFIVIVVQFLLLALSHGTGAILITIALVLYLLVLEKRISQKFPIGIIYVLGTVGFVLFALTIIPITEPLLNALGKDATLTGRIPLWNQVIQVMSNNGTFTGYGYGMFWRNPESIRLMHEGFSETSFMGNMTSGAHNTILELWTAIGVIGVLSFITMILLSTRRPQEIKTDSRQYIVVYLIYFMMTGWTERLMSNYEYPVLFFFFVMALGCSQRDTTQFRWHRFVPIKKTGKEVYIEQQIN